MSDWKKKVETIVRALQPDATLKAAFPNAQWATVTIVDLEREVSIHFDVTVPCGADAEKAMRHPRLGYVQSRTANFAVLDEEVLAWPEGRLVDVISLRIAESVKRLVTVHMYQTDPPEARVAPGPLSDAVLQAAEQAGAGLLGKIDRLYTAEPVGAADQPITREGPG